MRGEKADEVRKQGDEETYKGKCTWCCMRPITPSMTNYAVSRSPGQTKPCLGKCHGFQAKLHYSAYQRKICHHNADEIKSSNLKVNNKKKLGPGGIVENPNPKSYAS